MEKIITNRIGFSFAAPIVIVGVIISVAGIVAVLENPLVGIGLILGGPFIWLNSHGSQINIENRTYREYGSIYGIKRGAWKSLDTKPNVSVLMSRSGMTVHSRSNRTTTSIDQKFEVCLLGKNHRSKAVVQKFNQKKDAESYAKELAKLTQSTVVRYSPVVSQKTRSRR